MNLSRKRFFIKVRLWLKLIDLPLFEWKTDFSHGYLNTSFEIPHFDCPKKKQIQEILAVNKKYRNWFDKL